MKNIKIIFDQLTNFIISFFLKERKLIILIKISVYYYINFIYFILYKI